MSVRQGYPKRTFVGFGGYRKSVERQLIPRKMALRGFPPAMFAPLHDLYEALIKLQKNRDEMLEDFEIRKRPGHPYDFIVIAKFRTFVEGRRIYSAGNRTRFKVIEVAKQGYGRMIGHRWKRIGNSDYTYEIYGLRYQPLKWPQTDGKLFDNPSREAERLRRTAQILEEDERLVPSDMTYEDIMDDPKMVAHFRKIMTPTAWKNLVDDYLQRGFRRRDFIYPTPAEYKRMLSSNARPRWLGAKPVGIDLFVILKGKYAYTDAEDELDKLAKRHMGSDIGSGTDMQTGRREKQYYFKTAGSATRFLRSAKRMGVVQNYRAYYDDDDALRPKSIRLNPRPRTYMEERAEKIARMREEGFEPLPQGLGKATKLQLKLLGHGKAFYSRKWGERVKRTR